MRFAGVQPLFCVELDLRPILTSLCFATVDTLKQSHIQFKHDGSDSFVIFCLLMLNDFRLHFFQLMNNWRQLMVDANNLALVERATNIFVGLEWECDESEDSVPVKLRKLCQRTYIGGEI